MKVEKKNLWRWLIVTLFIMLDFLSLIFIPDRDIRNLSTTIFSVAIFFVIFSFSKYKLTLRRGFGAVLLGLGVNFTFYVLQSQSFTLADIEGGVIGFLVFLGFGLFLSLKNRKLEKH